MKILPLEKYADTTIKDTAEKKKSVDSSMQLQFAIFSKQLEFAGEMFADKDIQKPADILEDVSEENPVPTCTICYHVIDAMKAHRSGTTVNFATKIFVKSVLMRRRILTTFMQTTKNLNVSTFINNE